MSLVGSLEDLGIGDILQIVSLSRKSGRLLLRSSEGEGRIIFEQGLVRAAFVKGEPEDLRGLLVSGGFVDAEDADRAVDVAQSAGLPLIEVITQRTGIGSERIDSLRREQVERAVLRMFEWRAGEFSFEVRDEVDERDLELALPVGINPQYLMMEATRLGDERGSDGAASDEPDGAPGIHDLDTEPVFSGTPEPVETPAPGEAPVAAPPVREAPIEKTPVPPPGKPAARPPTSLVVIDPELRALEWLKSVLGGLFARVHIFQHSEGGIVRIRQYLARAEIPVVLVSTNAPADRLTGVSEFSELLSRLRAQAPRMPIVVMADESGERTPGIDAADAIVQRPPCSALVDRRRRKQVKAAAEALCELLEPWARGGNSPMPSVSGASPVAPAADAAAPVLAPAPERVNEVMERIRDRTSGADLLMLVLDFVAESFSRVAVFMVRDGAAIGLAQRGLSLAGGPDDAALGEMRVPLEEPAWFRRAIERREPLRAPPSDAGDEALAALLGSVAPSEAYVAPIETDGCVVALLYADNLPDDRPLGDTSALAAVLREAGLALNQALLERTRAAAEAGARGAGS